MKLLFHSVIFLGSFLLFQIQPMAAKQLLPVYGGSAAVWSACMLFFQVLLLLGYAYSHAAQKCPPRPQVALHSLLLLTATFLLPGAPAAGGMPGPHPVQSLLLALALGIGPSFYSVFSSHPWSPVLPENSTLAIPAPDPETRLWTDSYSNLFQLINRRY